MRFSRDGDGGQVVRITGPTKDEQEGLSIQLRERVRREIGMLS
jgi:hypothetical protein